MATQELWTIRETAEFLRCSPQAVRDRIRRGQLKAYRPSPGVTLFKRSEVEAYVEQGATAHTKQIGGNQNGGCFH